MAPAPRKPRRLRYKPASGKGNGYTGFHVIDSNGWKVIQGAFRPNKPREWLAYALLNIILRG